MNAQTNTSRVDNCNFGFNVSERKKQKDREDAWAKIEAMAETNAKNAPASESVPKLLKKTAGSYEKFTIVSIIAEPGKSMLVDEPIDDDVEMVSSPGHGEEQDSLIKDMVMKSLL